MATKKTKATQAAKPEKLEERVQLLLTHTERVALERLAAQEALDRGARVTVSALLRELVLERIAARR